jgi:hypothetical protein
MRWQANAGQSIAANVGKFDNFASCAGGVTRKCLLGFTFSLWHGFCILRPTGHWEQVQMSAADDRRERVILFCVPALVLLLGCGASLLPPATLSQVLSCLTVWTCLSLPLSVLVGHCALSED